MSDLWGVEGFMDVSQVLSQLSYIPGPDIRRLNLVFYLHFKFGPRGICCYR